MAAQQSGLWNQNRPAGILVICEDAVLRVPTGREIGVRADPRRRGPGAESGGTPTWTRA